MLLETHPHSRGSCTPFKPADGKEDPDRREMREERVGNKRERAPHAASAVMRWQKIKKPPGSPACASTGSPKMACHHFTQLSQAAMQRREPYSCCPVRVQVHAWLPIVCRCPRILASGREPLLAVLTNCCFVSRLEVFGERNEKNKER